MSYSIESDRPFIPKWMVKPRAMLIDDCDLAWYVERPDGSWQFQGCVLHSPGPLLPDRSLFVPPRGVRRTAGTPCTKCDYSTTRWTYISSGLLTLCCDRCTRHMMT